MIKVNGQEIVYRSGMTVADALKEAGISIDTTTLVIVDEKVISFDQLNREPLIDDMNIKLLPILSGG